MTDSNTCPDCDTATVMREGSEICPKEECEVTKIMRSNYELPRDENGVPRLERQT